MQLAFQITSDDIANANDDKLDPEAVEKFIRDDHDRFVLLVHTATATALQRLGVPPAPEPEPVPEPEPEPQEQ